MSTSIMNQTGKAIMTGLTITAAGTVVQKAPAGKEVSASSEADRYVTF
jgi:hypothetical protein